MTKTAKKLKNLLLNGNIEMRHTKFRVEGACLNNSVFKSNQPNGFSPVWKKRVLTLVHSVFIASFTAFATCIYS